MGAGETGEGTVDGVAVSRVGGVVTVVLDRPEKRNAVDLPMSLRLRAVLADAATRRDDRVLVLAGAGGAFCSGADLTDGAGRRGDVGAGQEPPRTADRLTFSGLGTGSALALMRGTSELAMLLHRLPMPTIARVDGIAAGMGCNLAFGCDLVLASTRARFAELFARRGLALDAGGSWLLPRLVGLQAAKELAFFGDAIDAERAERLGLVNRVVDPSDLDAIVADWAGRLAALPPLALAAVKAQLNRSVAPSMSDVVDREGADQALLLRTDDALEAMTAFVERRDGVYRGD